MLTRIYRIEEMDHARDWYMIVQLFSNMNATHTNPDVLKLDKHVSLDQGWGERPTAYLPIKSQNLDK